MDQSLRLVGIRTPQDIGFAADDRFYGCFFATPEQRFDQPLPPAFAPLQDELRSGLTLLRLAADDGLTHGRIFAAYKADIAFLGGRFRELADCVKNAIRYSVITQFGGPYGASERSDPIWKQVIDRLPALTNGPAIDLSADRAILPPAELLPELQDEARAAVTKLLKQLCFWLDELVHVERIGLFRTTAPTVGHYFYFRPETVIIEDGSKRLETSVDDTQPFGERITYTETRGVWRTEREWLERHDHHIVEMKIQSVEAFEKPMPARVAHFLDAVPDWLLPHLQVVSGTITKEVKHRRLVGESESYYEEVLSVWKGSPAVTLGHWSLIGWSADDLKGYEQKYSRGRVRASVEDGATKLDRESLSAAVVVILVLCILFGGLFYASIAAKNESTAAYQEYVASNHLVGEGWRTREILTLKNGQQTQLPRGEPLYYFGSYRSSDHNNKSYVTFATMPGDSWDNPNRLQVTLARFDDAAYGTVDLGPKLGIKAVAHVLRATNQGIEFAVNYYDEK